MVLLFLTMVLTVVPVAALQEQILEVLQLQVKVITADQVIVLGHHIILAVAVVALLLWVVLELGAQGAMAEMAYLHILLGD